MSAYYANTTTACDNYTQLYSSTTNNSDTYSCNTTSTGTYTTFTYAIPAKFMEVEVGKNLGELMHVEWSTRREKTFIRPGENRKEAITRRIAEIKQEEYIDDRHEEICVVGNLEPIGWLHGDGSFEENPKFKESRPEWMPVPRVNRCNKLYKHFRRLKSPAEQKSEALFRKVLGGEMYRELIRRKHIVILGNDKNKYLIKKGETSRIVCEDGTSYGNHSSKIIPYFDEALARILALKTHAKAIRDMSCKLNASESDMRLLNETPMVY